jgi:lipopolysaccharide/colanic/teichoic acid biosynthesis glycosyltransferase
MQRFFDILLSIIAILILSPLFLIIIIALSLTGEREVFYVQKRVGIEGNIFGAFKFATMVKNSSKMGTGFITTKNDPRVLPIGRVLRKTKLNEFPQLFNILIGDMSFVGPRPQVQKHFDVFPDHVKSKIVKIRPGLTGIGSIIFRDEESILEKNKHLSYDECYSSLIAPYKGELELWYIKNKNLYTYFMLIALTVWVVIFPKSKIYMRIFSDLPKPISELKL